MLKEDGYIGFIKYDGELVADGLMDARKQAYALLGVDSALRYFVGKFSPDFREIDYEIPVRVNKGSWETLIPETIGGWVQAGLGVVATAYFSTAANKMAEKDFKDFGFTDVFRKAIEATKWFVRISKHVGSASVKKFEDVVFSARNELVGIKNDAGEVLYVPKEMLDIYVATNPMIIEGLASNVEIGRELRIGTISPQIVDEVVVDIKSKHIFCRTDDDDNDEILFPELVHGEDVVLEGEVTRENKTTNSMGFKYKEHILSSYPQSGSIVPYKQLLFLRCRIFATVSRMDDDGRPLARRPKLYFSRIEQLYDQGHEDDLFGGA
ncbi:hypothetical protein [Pseudomonas multiresinivorans]|uniref:Uncharacterized protein n=1 Tax=Pseudomonas multiresinivorans TaxID=95301 RepID=A0A7Z3GPL1_9PSED|nr:hypothetical protein [Pseudomonas multiresinivorans]QJP07774.1 hypothetical protein G4G71_07755 [Pseudomonas multiresinivorans]